MHPTLARSMKHVQHLQDGEFLWSGAWSISARFHVSWTERTSCLSSRHFVETAILVLSLLRSLEKG